MLYGSYSRGFKSGGFDTRALAAFGGDVEKGVAPETLDAYEIGLKSELLGSTLRLNAASFYYIWNDLQTFATINSVPGFYNIPEAQNPRIRGGIQWAARQGLDRCRAGSDCSTPKSPTSGASPAPSIRVTSCRTRPSSRPMRSCRSEFLRGELAQAASGCALCRQAGRFAAEQTRSSSTNEAQTILNARVSYAFGRGFALRDQRVRGEPDPEKTCVDIGPFDDPSVTPASLATLQTATNQCAPNDGTALFGISAKMSF